MSILKNGIIAAVFYAFSSVSMAFLNKAVISSYKFNFPFSIMACQMTVTILFLQILKQVYKINIVNYEQKSAKLFLYPSFGYALHSILSLMALEGLNIPMYTAVKRCTPLVNLVLAVFILNKPFPSALIVISILMITVGCIIAVMGDITFDMFAYSVGGLSVIAQGVYLTLVQKSTESKLSPLDILYLNSCNTVIPFTLLAFITREHHGIIHSSFLNDTIFLAMFSTLVCLGAVLNYSLFLCTTLNSALTTSLVSVGKSSLQTIIGLFLFGGISYNLLNLIGILLNLIGGIVYIFLKYRESNFKKKQDLAVSKESV